MLTFRRALIVATIFIITVYFITHSYKPLSTFSVDKSHTPSKNTPSTDGHVFVTEKSSQRPLTDLSHASLREKLTYQYPYDLEIRFPAYIWQTWKYTPASGEFKESYRPAEASWTELHPSFIHEVITDQVALHLLRHLYASIPEILDAYNSLPLAVLKADFFRYLILFARGGIYADIDTHVVKSAIEWLPESVPREAIGLIIGVGSDPDREDWISKSFHRLLFCQWTIQSKPGHPVLREVIARITENTLERVKNGSLSNFDTQNIHEFTGSVIWTDVIFSFFNDERYFNMTTSTGNITWKDFTGMKSAKKVGDVAVLPITSFSPGISQMDTDGFNDPLAFVRHEFAATWKPEQAQLKDASKI
ncbi:Initiation-specific alpha-1,6-mannosyltransferase [Erysiphe neolycopersici]|uniref:Initiation-specific alpha-1,6-mannosyltransferase n=1 Tax=Erysiphe neolycopersici TaxID=212602 RepID=A0A420HPC0_9PEZI|nr:Initiation-specific alpha-1,6-mannosyltransferase [Erysiphe neolycopersici]